MSPQPRPATVDTVMEAWQRDAVQPTWAQILAMKQEHTALRATAARQASLLRGCYAADDKQKQRIEELAAELEAEREESKRWLVKAQNERDARKELEAELERIKALPPVAWRSSMGHGVTLKESITDDQKAFTWDGKPMWQPLIALGSKTDE